jgi:hypothetical protein
MKRWPCARTAPCDSRACFVRPPKWSRRGLIEKIRRRLTYPPTLRVYRSQDQTLQLTAPVSLVQGSGEVDRFNQEGDPVVITYDSAGAEADRAFEIVLFLPSP